MQSPSSDAISFLGVTVSVGRRGRGGSGGGGGFLGFLPAALPVVFTFFFGVVVDVAIMLSLSLSLLLKAPSSSRVDLVT